MSFSKIAPCVCIAAMVGCGNDHANGGDDGFQADPPSVYVAKVKNILTGLAPTDDEVKAVTADPNALPGLIDGWMQTQQYQDKMRVFFELAFQQTQITDVDFVANIPPRGLGQGRAVPLLVQNAEESFARTVLQLQAEGRPLTEAFTTKRVMMTTALMNLYAFLDERRVADDATITDPFAAQNPGLNVTLEASAGPIDPRDSVDPTKTATYMHFYNPDIKTQNYPDATCIGVDPISFRATSLDTEAMLYGEIPNHQGPSGPCPTRGGTLMGPQIKGTDYTDWRMVTIRPPANGEKRTTFYDLYTLRSASELVIATPHPGFFSTPAFFANWPTNSSNTMRVTVNQALIVATGAQVDGNDATTPSTTPGLDAAHAQPGTACFGCHQLLDPTRSILSATYSWFYYPQTDATLKSQPGLFAFNGVIAPMQNIDDFANLLATHPLVPTAWGQKLCYYANSAACDPTDPEFQRITNDFKSSNFAWNTLVREMMSSPIVTNATETTTAQTNGEIVSVSRRDHLCAQLNNRLGLVDICELDQTFRRGQPSTVASIVTGLPSDGYGRGSTVPVLPTDANLFYRAGLENICISVSQMVVDAAPNPQQPGARNWKSSDYNNAIDDFIGLMMGLTASDPRADQARAILHDHFNAASQSGASATDSLRSTFVVACLSPSFIGIGM
jgi:hypothetical protein